MIAATEVTPREALRTAQQDLAALQQEIATSETALAEASRMAFAAKAELDQFANLDKAISQSRVEALKSGNDPRDLPASLKKQAQQKRDAEIELNQAIDARDLLKEQLAVLTVSEGPLNDELVQTAGRLMLEKAAVLVEELDRLQDKRWRLVQITNALLGMTFLHSKDGYRRAVATDAEAAAIRSAMVERAPEFPYSADPLSVVGRCWAAELQSLLADADHEVQIPEAVSPSYFNPSQQS